MSALCRAYGHPGTVPAVYRAPTYTFTRGAIVRFTPSKPRATTSARMMIAVGRFTRFFADTDCYLFASSSRPQMHRHARDWVSKGKLD